MSSEPASRSAGEPADGSTGERARYSADRPGSAPAKKPVRAPAAAIAGIVAALAVIAVGAVAIRDTLGTAGLLDGESWLEWLFGKAEVLKPVDWMIPAGIGAVLIGLWFVVAAVKPRKATHQPLGDGGVWIRDLPVEER